MSDIKKWGSDECHKFTDTSMGKITYSGPATLVDDGEINFGGVISTVAMFKAAPDMYKALEEARYALWKLDVDVSDIDKALSKARGECHG